MFNAADRNRYLGLAQGLITRACIVVGIQAAVSVADAALTISVDEVGGNVVFSGSGSINTSGMNTSNGVSVSDYVSPVNGVISLNPNLFTLHYLFGGSSEITFGTGLSFTPDVMVGDDFFLSSSAMAIQVGVTSGYVSNDPFSFTSTFNSQTLSSMGMPAGSTLWTLPSGDTITLNVGAAVVPEPSTYIAMAGFAGLGALVWRRRRAKAKAAK